MEVHLTDDQQAFVRQAIADGRLRNEQQALDEALALWEERERRRLEITASVESARAEHARGEGRLIDADTMRRLGNDVKARGRTRLAAEQQRQD